MLDVSLDSKPTDWTIELALRRGVYEGICMYLEEKWLAKLLTVKDDPEAVPQWAVPRWKIDESIFEWFVSQQSIREKIMPIVALKIAEWYGIPLRSRWRKDRSYYTSETFGMSDSHYEILVKYMPMDEVSRIRNNMWDSYNSSDTVEKNPHLKTNIDNIWMSVVKIDAPQYQQSASVSEDFSQSL